MPVSLQGPGRRSGSWIETESQLDEWAQLCHLMGYLDDLGAKNKSWEALAGSRQRSALGHGAVCAQTLYNVLAVQCFGWGVCSAAPIQQGQSSARQPWPELALCALLPHLVQTTQTSHAYSACQQTLIKPQDWSELLRFVFGGRKKRRQFLSDYLVKLLRSRQYKSLCQVVHKSFLCLSSFSVDKLIIALMSS